MSDNSPLVSVIIPLYNREQFLPQLFANLAQQIYQNFELVLVDDGSTDGTEQWINQHKLISGQPTVYLKQSNSGPYSARNRGLNIAMGKYIAFQDSDDEWPDYHLSEFVEALEKYSNVDWLFGSLRRIEHGTGKIKEASNFIMKSGTTHPFIGLQNDKRGKINVINDVKASETAILHCVPGSTQCALIRRTLFENNLFDDSYRTAYDRFFAIKAVMSGFTFAFVKNTHQIYHIHDSHISLVAGADANKLQKSAETMLKGYGELLDLAKNQNETDAIKHELARVNAWELSIALQQKQQYRQASKAMFNAWRLQPKNLLYIKSFLVCLVKYAYYSFK
ncbi:glycosyltransferase family 2 protein [Paraglaciecola sp. 25GB23A]|uniref:glycosyltransferase family 2 protein n=1 Tax=Paraglaciecola sp. 25GB23A TaxID=3156068 RepID=UPI0032AFDEC2